MIILFSNDADDFGMSLDFVQALFPRPMHSLTYLRISSPKTRDIDASFDLIAGMTNNLRTLKLEISAFGIPSISGGNLFKVIILGIVSLCEDFSEADRYFIAIQEARNTINV